MNMQGLLLSGSGSSSGSMGVVTIVYLVLIFAFFYFFLIRPGRKEQKEKEALLSTLEIGDSVLTSSGFYGVVIDVTDDTVIVEFGNNKNCRIPMQKAAIVQIEKPEQSVAADDGAKSSSADAGKADKKEKKGLFRK